MKKQLIKKRQKIKTYEELREFALDKLSEMMWKDVRDIIK